MMSINIQQIEENRILYDGIGSIYPAVSNISIRKEQIDNVDCYWFEPENPKPNELVIYVHGGGYCIGSIQSHRAMVSHFAHHLNRTIVFVEYGLAPENPYPKGMNNVVTIYKELTKKYADSVFYLFGDSAGGGLIISTVNEIYKSELKLPRAIALISPWYNLETNNSSLDSRQHLDQILNKEMVQNFAYAYAGKDLSIADPSKLKFEHFPPVFVGVGTNEILFDDAVNFYEMVYKIQPQSYLKIYGGQGHVLTQLDVFSHSSKDLMMNINNFLEIPE